MGKRIWICFSLCFLIGITACQQPEKSRDKKEDLKFDWKLAGELPRLENGTPAPGLAGAVIGIAADYLLVGGGSNFPDAAPWDGGTKTYYDEVFVFRKENDSLIPLPETYHLGYRVAYSANSTSKEGIFVIGGEDENGAVNRASFVKWNDGKNQLELHELPNLPEPLTAGAVTELDGYLYFGGGQNHEGVSQNLWKLDLEKVSEWKKITELPQPTSHSALLGVDHDGKKELYLVGGRRAHKDSISDLYQEVYAFDLQKEEWHKKASLPYALAAHSGVVWKNKELLIFSGDQGETFNQTEEMLMEIAKEKDSLQLEKKIAQKDSLQKSHPGFGGEVLHYDIEKDGWKQIDSIPFHGQVTTTTVVWGERILIPNGEIRAGIRTPDIIMGIKK